MNSDMLVHFRVFGRVQGVFFRATTVEEAKKLGLAGWCHNHPDESVEGVALGPKNQLDKFREYLQKGPEMARVKEVKYVTEVDHPDEEAVKRMLVDPTGHFEKRRYKDFEAM